MSARRNPGTASRTVAAPARGLGVAAKFSLATSLVVAGAMCIFTAFLYQMVSSVLSREIDDAGVLSVRAMAVVDMNCWRPWHETVLEGREEEFRDKQPKVLQEELESFKARTEANQLRAQRVAGSGVTKVLDAVILDREQRTVINGQGPIRFSPTGEQRSVEEVRILEGVYDLRAQRTRARTYTAPILDVGGEVAGYAVVALSEAKIGETLGRLLRLMMLLTALFIGLGLVVSWFVGQRITGPIVALTADIDTVARGDLEHRTHVRTGDEIGVMARAFDRMTQNLLHAKDLEKKQAAQEHELGVARQVQDALFPETLPEIQGFECAAQFKLVGGIGGDYYDVTRLANGDFLFVLGSASGGGIPGAMVVTMGRSLIKAVAEHEDSPAEALRRVNRLLAPDLRRGMYVTALLVRLHPASGKITSANAGHPGLLVIRKGSRRADVVLTDGIALGFDKGPVFDRGIRDGELTLEPGDRLVLCTRSVLEAGGPEAEQGAAEVLALIARESSKNSSVFIPTVLHGLQKLRGGEPREDLALLTVKRLS